jgi:hypothetical protein
MSNLIISRSFEDIFSVGHDGKRVIIRFRRDCVWSGYGVSWQRADALAAELKNNIPKEDPPEPTTLVTVDFVVQNVVHVLPKKLAQAFYKALVAKARDAEEQDKAESIAMDAAILLRAGANFGLSSDPKIQEEAKKESAWNSDLRRYMTGGIRSLAVFGRPTVTALPAEEKPGVIKS